MVQCCHVEADTVAATTGGLFRSLTEVAGALANSRCAGVSRTHDAGYRVELRDLETLSAWSLACARGDDSPDGDELPGARDEGAVPELSEMFALHGLLGCRQWAQRTQLGCTFSMLPSGAEDCAAAVVVGDGSMYVAAVVACAKGQSQPRLCLHVDVKTVSRRTNGLFATVEQAHRWLKESALIACLCDERGWLQFKHIASRSTFELPAVERGQVLHDRKQTKHRKV